MEDWELSSRSKVEISGEDSINQEKKEKHRIIFAQKINLRAVFYNGTYDL